MSWNGVTKDVALEAATREATILFNRGPIAIWWSWVSFRKFFSYLTGQGYYQFSIGRLSIIILNAEGRRMEREHGTRRA